jgi:hypothetical protein
MHTKESIRALLQTNDKAVCRGILAVYAYQTASEKIANHTEEDNGVGFNGVDGRILSDFAKGIKKYGRLTEKQMYHARKKIMKYAGQLAKIANEKAAEQAAA